MVFFALSFEKPMKSALTSVHLRPILETVRWLGLEAIGNQDDGYVVHTNGSVTFRDSIGNNNDYDGFQIAAWEGLSFIDITAEGNGDDGITAGTNQDLLLDRCICNDNHGTWGDGLDIFDDGWVGGDVTIRHSEAWRNSDDGFELDNTYGSVIITDSIAMNNGSDGFNTYVDGDVTFEDTVSQGNGATCNEDDGDGYDIETDGKVTILHSAAIDNDQEGIDVGIARQGVVLENCTADRNGGEGVDIDDIIGDVSIRNCTSSNNASGFEIGWDQVVGNVQVSNSIATDNQVYGIYLGDLVGSSHLIQGGIICNNFFGAKLDSAATVDIEGNWWGDVSGPFHTTGNPTGLGNSVVDSGSGGGSGTLGFDPWIDTLSRRAIVRPPSKGLPIELEFQFSGGDGSVFLGPGPGVLNATTPFSLTTDNGTLTSSLGTGTTVPAIVDQPNGTFTLTLVPATEGLTTVTLKGPCNLDAVLSIQPSYVYIPLAVKSPLVR